MLGSRGLTRLPKVRPYAKTEVPELLVWCLVLRIRRDNVGTSHIVWLSVNELSCSFGLFPCLSLGINHLGSLGSKDFFIA